MTSEHRQQEGPITDVVHDVPLIDELLAPHRAALGTIHAGYRGHAYRMFNFVRALAPGGHDDEGRDERIAIVAAVHDLPVLDDGNLVYLERAADLAVEHAHSIGHPEWAAELRLMIETHHKCRPYTGPHAGLVEATRQADWIDVTFTRLRFGLPRAYVHEVANAFPLTGLYPMPAWSLMARYALRHPRNPMPMMRW